jgi:hypothetical protein
LLIDWLAKTPECTEHDSITHSTAAIWQHKASMFAAVTNSNLGRMAEGSDESRFIRPPLTNMRFASEESN